ncbi:MAG TPA: hypothetical protein VM368_02650 [Flavisolibacter sp.]|nr:hypothetical protein [Flavisolibacter sp.]
MDEYSQGMDPEVKKYFKQILYSFIAVTLWLFIMITFGIYFRMGEVRNGVKWYNVFFYVILLLTFFFLIYKLIRIWKKKA